MIGDSLFRASVDKNAEIIKEKILGGLIFGGLVIEEDVNSMICAAYYLAMQEMQAARLSELDEE